MILNVKKFMATINLIDIDECALGIDRCDQNCHNNIGSYTCSCNPGWRLDFDGFRCNGKYVVNLK